MENPFYFQEVPVDAPFCNRKRKLKELRIYAEGRANVVFFSPRRYGYIQEHGLGSVGGSSTPQDN